MPTPTPVQHVYGQRKEWLPPPASSSGAMHLRHGEGGGGSSPTPGFGHHRASSAVTSHHAIVKPVTPRVTQPFSTFGPQPSSHNSALPTSVAGGGGGSGEKESAASLRSHSSPSEGHTLLRSLFPGLSESSGVGGWNGGNSAGATTSYLASLLTGNDASETATGGTFAGSSGNHNDHEHEHNGSVTSTSPSMSPDGGPGWRMRPESSSPVETTTSPPTVHKMTATSSRSLQSKSSWPTRNEKGIGSSSFVDPFFGNHNPTRHTSSSSSTNQSSTTTAFHSTVGLADYEFAAAQNRYRQQRLLATSAGGFRYIPSPLSKRVHRVEGIIQPPSSRTESPSMRLLANKKENSQNQADKDEKDETATNNDSWNGTFFEWQGRQPNLPTRGGPPSAVSTLVTGNSKQKSKTHDIDMLLTEPPSPTSPRRPTNLGDLALLSNNNNNNNASARDGIDDCGSTASSAEGKRRKIRKWRQRAKRWIPGKDLTSSNSDDDEDDSVASGSTTDPWTATHQLSSLQSESTSLVQSRTESLGFQSISSTVSSEASEGEDDENSRPIDFKAQQQHPLHEGLIIPDRGGKLPSKSTMSSVPRTPPRGRRLLNKASSLVRSPRSRKSSRATTEVVIRPVFSKDSIAEWKNCIHVRAEGGRTGTLCLTATHLIFKFDDHDGDVGESMDESASNNGDMYEDGYISNPEEEEENTGGASMGALTATTLSNLEDEAERNEKQQEAQKLIRDVLKEVSSPTELEPEEVRLMRIRRQRQNSQSSSSSCSSNSSSSSEDDDTKQSLHDQVLDESYDEMMNASLIRAIEEEARRRLQELDDDEGSRRPEESAVAVAAISTWEREHLEVIEHRARRYLKKLDNSDGDTGGDSESELDEDRKALYAGAIRRSFGHLESRLENKFATLNFEQDGNRRYQSDQLNDSGHPIGLDKDEENRWYTTGDANTSSSRGIKWPLNRISEAYPRRYMMRNVAIELFGPSPVMSSTSTMSSSPIRPSAFSSSNSLSSAGGNSFEESEFGVPLRPLSTQSIFFAIPDIIDICDDTDDSSRRKRRKKRKNSRRDDAISIIKDYAPAMNVTYWNLESMTESFLRWGGAGRSASDNSSKGEKGRRSWTPASLFKRRGQKASDPLHLLTRAWRRGQISNYDYLMRINTIAGRSCHDPSHYPVMPWVLSNYCSETVPDLTDEKNFRNLSKPMGALDPNRLEKFMKRFMSLCGHGDSAIPPFMYGSHYSSSGGVVLHYLVRLRPFAGLHRQLQGGQFDVADRLFDSVPRTWDMCSQTSPTEVKELTPEWYSDPSFLVNSNCFDLGTSVDGKAISDVVLPPWAEGSPSKFVDIMRQALESDVCSSMLSSWIDLIFGFKQRGWDARQADNLFYHLTYYDTEDLARIEDEGLRTETELHIADFGHCPSQLFVKAHPKRKMESLKSKSKDDSQKMSGLRNKGRVKSPKRQISTNY